MACPATKLRGDRAANRSRRSAALRVFFLVESMTPRAAKLMAYLPARFRALVVLRKSRHQPRVVPLSMFARSVPT